MENSSNGEIIFAARIIFDIWIIYGIHHFRTAESPGGHYGRAFAYGCVIVPQNTNRSKLHVGGSIADGAYMNDATNHVPFGKENAWVV